MPYYIVPNQITGGWDCVVPSESYIPLLEKNSFARTITVGDQQTADEMLAKNREEYLKQESYRFIVHRVEYWRTREYITGCDLDSEPDNDTMIYGVYDVHLNEHVRVVGNAAALEKRKQIQDRFLEDVKMDRHALLTFIPLD
jgi:hypothetical protein